MTCVVSRRHFFEMKQDPGPATPGRSRQTSRSIPAPRGIVAVIIFALEEKKPPTVLVADIRRNELHPRIKPRPQRLDRLARHFVMPHGPPTEAVGPWPVGGGCQWYCRGGSDSPATTCRCRGSAGCGCRDLSRPPISGGNPVYSEEGHWVVYDIDRSQDNGTARRFSRLLYDSSE